MKRAVTYLPMPKKTLKLEVTGAGVLASGRPLDFPQCSGFYPLQAVTALATLDDDRIAGAGAGEQKLSGPIRCRYLPG